jgi:hypothetical protein
MKSEFVDRDGNVVEIGEVVSSSEKFAITSVVDELNDVTNILEDRISAESVKRAEAIQKLESDTKKSFQKVNKKLEGVAGLSKTIDKLSVELNYTQGALDRVTKSFSQYVKHKHKMSFEFLVGEDSKIYIQIKKLFKNMVYHEMKIPTDAVFGNQGEIYPKKLRGGFVQIKHVYPSPACPTYKVSNTYIVNFEQKTYIKN